MATLPHPKSTRVQPRRGLATLEFVLVMPILLFLFLIIWGFANTHAGRSRAIVQSKNKAWKARYGNLEAESEGNSSEAGKLATSRRASGEVNPGISRKEHATPVKVAWFLGPPGMKAKRTHVVLGGAYDHRNIRLNQPSSEIPPLVPNSRFYFFAGDVAMNIFQQAGNLNTLFALDNPNGGTGADLGKLMDNIHRLTSRIEKSINNIRDSFEDLIDAEFYEIPIPALWNVVETLLTEGVSLAGSAASMGQNISQIGGALGIPELSQLQGLASGMSLSDPFSLLSNLGSLGDAVTQFGNFGQAWGNYRNLTQNLFRTY